MGTKTYKTPSLPYSVFVLICLALSTFIGMKILGASLNVIMFLNWLLMTLLSLPLGFTYNDLEKKAAQNISGIMTTLFIIYAIGALAGSWMASGTVPAIIYYGMNIMSANFFLPAALILCSIVSIATGTSWGTLGTMGVALLGIGSGLGIPAGMTAAAAICGSWFGDKTSPLSDTTNFTSTLVGANLFTHIRHTMYTNAPAYLITLLGFTILGLKTSASAELDAALIQSTQQGIAGYFRLGFPVAVPALVVLIMLLMRKNAVLSLLTGAFAGVIVAVVYQRQDTALAFNSIYNGFNGTFENEFLATLLNRGGITGMLSTSMTMIFCVGIGGMMKEMGVIHVIVEKFSTMIHSVFSLIFISEVIAYVSQMLSGSHYFSDVMLQSTMLDIYKKKGLKPENLSRVMEDCNTIGGTLIPWSATGLYIAATLGITFSEYAPFVFLCYLTPIMELFCAITGWGIKRYTEEELSQERKEEVPA